MGLYFTLKVFRVCMSVYVCMCVYELPLPAPESSHCWTDPESPDSLSDSGNCAGSERKTKTSTSNSSRTSIKQPLFLLELCLSIILSKCWSWIWHEEARGGCVPAGRRLWASFPTGRGVWGRRRRPGWHREPDRGCLHLQEMTNTVMKI